MTRKPGNLIQPLYFEPAKAGNTDRALMLLKIFLSQLIDAEEAFEPCLVKYMKQAIERIIKGDNPAHALWITTEGRKNKHTTVKTTTRVRVALEIHRRVLRGEKKTKIYKDMINDSIAKPLGLLEADAFRKIYKHYLPALENDEF